MRLFSILLKYGPWRNALLVAYENTKAVRGRIDVQARAERILNALLSTCEAMNGVIPEAWIQHLGHNVTHCSGPVPTLTSLRVLRPAACGRSGVKKLRFGKQLRFKRVCHGQRERGQALDRIAQYVKVADEIGDLEAPRTCQDWVESNEKLVGLLKGVVNKSGVCRQAQLHKPRQSQGKYCFGCLSGLRSASCLDSCLRDTIP